MDERGEAVKRAAEMLSRMSPALRALETLLSRNGKAAAAAGERTQNLEPEESPKAARKTATKATPKAPPKAARKRRT